MLAQMENNRHCREVRRRDRTDERRSASCSDTPTKKYRVGMRKKNGKENVLGY